MESGLAGFGKSGNWSVDIDEHLADELFDLSIDGGFVYVMIRSIELSLITSLSKYLAYYIGNASDANDTTLLLANDVQFVTHDGSLEMAISQHTELSSHHIRYTFSYEDVCSINKALIDALSEVES